MPCGIRWGSHDFLAKGRERQLGQAEVHLPERNADDGDAEENAEEEMGNPYPYAADKEPQHVHEQVQATGLRLLAPDLRTERPEGENAEFHALQPEGYADDGDHQGQSRQEVFDGDLQSAEDDPDDVS